MKNLYTLFFVMIISIQAFSQNGNVGVNTNSPNAKLDIVSSNSGILIPRVALTGTGDITTIPTRTISELIYNTTTVSDVTPGFYYWDGSTWVRLRVGDEGDNLGNHIATQNITMNDYNLLDANTVQANTLLDPEDGTITINDALTVTGDVRVQGGDVYDNSGHLRLSGEDHLYLSMDYNNDDIDDKAIMFGKNDEGGNANWVELMRITEAGKVGIGTTSPDAQVKLHLAGGYFGMDNNQAISWKSSSGTMSTILRLNSSNAFTLRGLGGGVRILDSGGIEKVGIDNAGNMGIGITIPAQKLHVVGTTRISTLSGTGTRGVYANTNGDLTTTGPTSGVDGYWIRTGTSLKPRITGDDILLNSPGRIEIQAGDRNIEIDDANPTWYGDAYGGVVYFYGDGGLSASKLHAGGLELNRKLKVSSNADASGTAGSGAIEIGTGTEQVRLDGNEIITNANRPLYINSDNNGDVQMDGGTFFMDASAGRVGVGNTAPSQKLHVTGSSLVSIRSYIGTTGAYFFSDSPNRIATPGQFYVQSTSPNTYLYSTNTYLGASSGDVTHLRGNNFDWDQGVIQGSGSVGIGTTSPTQKLHVVGNIRATSLVNGVIKADASGNFSVTTLTGSTGDVLLGNGTFGPGSAFGDNLGNHTATTTLNMNNNAITNVNYVSTKGANSYDKLRVWNSSYYTIGMYTAQTLGYLNDYAMTFTMNNDIDRGFLWRDYDDASGDGAMSLTTNGRLYLKSTAHFNGSVGIGTSAPTQKLHVEGNIRIANGGYIDDDATLAGNSDDWIRLNGYIELKSNTDSYGIVLRDKDNSEYFGITQANGYSILTDYSSSGNYFLRGNGANIEVRGRANFHAATDANGSAGSGVIEISNTLRIDGNEIITNASTQLLLQHDNNGDLRVDNNTFVVDASTNRVGVGTTVPSYKMHIIGKIKTDGITESSDIRLKKNIGKLDNALEKVMMIDGVSYDWRTDEFPEFNLETGRQIGIIAQDIEKIIPEVVNTDNDGYKSIEYSHLVPVLIEAIKDQQQIIQSQGKKINQLTSVIEKQLGISIDGTTEEVSNK